MSDAVLEWWSRCAAWIGITAAAWLAAAVLVFYCAAWIEQAILVASADLSVDRSTSTTIVSVLIPLFSSAAGLAARGTSSAGPPSGLRLALQRLALPFIIVMLDEAIDLRNFAMLDPEFPHDSTGNQFFSEAQFESYRALGCHSVLSVAQGLSAADANALCLHARQALAGTMPQAVR